MENLKLSPDSLEKAIDSAKTQAEPAAEAQVQEEAPGMTPEEEIGFHKGALNTLMAERNELAKMIGNVEAIMQAHIKRLEELGVKLQ